MLDTLAINRASAVAALAVTTARLHAQVDEQQEAALVELDDVYNEKVAAAEAALKVGRGAAAELATVTAAAEAALDPMCSPGTRVHVARSVAASLPLAAARSPPSIDTTLEFEVPPELPFDSVGLLVINQPSEAVAAVDDGAREVGVHCAWLRATWLSHLDVGYFRGAQRQ